MRKLVKLLLTLFWKIPGLAAIKNKIDTLIISIKSVEKKYRNELDALKKLLRHCARALYFLGNLVVLIARKSYGLLGRKATREREERNLEVVKKDLELLAEYIISSEKDVHSLWSKQFEDIVVRVEQEQNDLKDLSERHATISSFLVTRGVDDLSSNVFLNLKKTLAI